MSNAAAAQWVKFFNAAGIPSPAAATYAHIFVENRIQNDMLMDLNKEYLREMGITPMGDIIAILRHAKVVCDQTAREKVLTSSEINVPVAAVQANPQLQVDRFSSGNKISLKSASGVSSSVSFGNKNSSSTGKSFCVKSSAAVVTPLLKQPRRVLPEHEGKYKIKLPSGTTERSKEILAKQAKLYSECEGGAKRPQIFERLAKHTTRTVDLTDRKVDDLDETNSESSEFEREGGNMRIKVSGVAGKNNFTSSNSSSIFDRLGGRESDNMSESLISHQIKPILKNAPKLQNRSAIVKAKSVTSVMHVRPQKQKVILVKKVPLKRSESDEDDYDNHGYTDNDIDMDDEFASASSGGNSEKIVKFASTAEVREIASSPRYRASPVHQKSRFRRQTNHANDGGVKSRLGSIGYLHSTKKTYNLKAASTIHGQKRTSPVKVKSVRMKSDELMFRQDLPVHKRLGNTRTEYASTTVRKSISEISKRIKKVNLTTPAVAQRRKFSSSEDKNAASVFDRLGFNS